MPDENDLLAGTDENDLLAGEPEDLLAGVDYTSDTPGASMFTRFQMGRQRNPTETERYLDKKFGIGGWAKAGGAYVIKPEIAKKLNIPVKGDLPVAINPFGFDRGDIAQIGGEMAGPLVGGIAGGIAGGGLGFFPGVAASAIGSGLGEAADAGIKALEGTYAQTPKELAGNIGTEALTSAIGEGGYRIVAPIAGKLLGPHLYRDIKLFGRRSELKSSVDPERLALGKKAMEQGYSPHVSTMTGKNLAGRLQSASEYIFGSEMRTTKNRTAMIDARNKISTTVGGPARDSQELMSVDVDSMIARSGAEVNDAARQKLAESTGVLANIDEMVNHVQAQTEKSLFKGFAKSDPSTGMEVKQALEKLRRGFYEQGTETFRAYDALIGGNSIDVNNIRGLAMDYLDRGIMKTSKEGVETPLQAGHQESVSFMMQLAKMDRAQSAEAVFNLREALKSSTAGELGAPAHIRQQLSEAADTALRNSAKTQKAKGFLNKALKMQDDHAAQLGSYEVQRLLIDPSAAKSISADEVIPFINDLNPDQVVRLQAALPKPTWKKVQRGVFDDMITSVRSPNNVIDAEALHKRLLEKGGSLDALYGSDKANQIRTYSKFLSARNGEIPLESLEKGDPYTVLRDAASKRQAVDKFVDDNKDIIKIISNKSYPVETLVPTLLTKNNVPKVNQLKALLGENSEAWKKFQAAAMEKVLQPLVTKSDDAVQAVLSPQNLETALSKYGPETLYNVFGKEVTTDLYNFTRVAKFATSQTKGFAGSIVAANIALHPLAHLPALVKWKAIQRTMMAPGFLKYMTEGIAKGGNREALRAAGRIATQTVSHLSSVTGDSVPEEENGD